MLTLKAGPVVGEQHFLAQDGSSPVPRKTLLAILRVRASFTSWGGCV